MSSSSSWSDPYNLREPLLPVSSFARDPSASTSISASTPKPYPPSSSSSTSRPSPPAGLTTRKFPPRRVLAIPLALVAVLLLGRYLSHSTNGIAASSSSASSPASRWLPWRASLSPSHGPGLDARFARAREALPPAAGLAERLRVWEKEVPGWEVESADWVRVNLEFCPPYRIRPNENGNLLNNAHTVWSSMNSTRVMQLRGEMIAYLRRREKEGAMREESWGEGKGLVFTAGNADTFSRVLLTLKMLRNDLHTTLPSEIFSFPGEEPDADIRKELEAYGATLRVVEDATRDASRTKNYHIKATAIIRSRFREVLFLDSDNIPTASLMPASSPVPHAAPNVTRVGEDGRVEEGWGAPAGLWESKAYQRLGAFFWPDYWRTQADNTIWALIGVPCRDEWEQEAGQMLVDKARHLDALLLAEWMMDSTRFKFWFNFSDGDKDMFRFAWLALRKRWGVPGRYVSVAALPRNTMTGFCGHTMLQHDHVGKPLFVHANLLKQIPSGVGRGNAWGRHRQVRTQPTSLSLSATGAGTYPSSLALEALEPLTDDDVDCDMLADVGDDGLPARGRVGAEVGYRVRRRAVIEKGIRAGFHGGWASALCIDTRWDDPRSDEKLTSSRHTVALSLPNPSHLPLSELAASVDVTYTSAPDGFEVRFTADEALEIVQWSDDARLSGFEEAFFAEGGRLNGKGF